MKIINGNGTNLRNSITVAHWNMGSKHWQRDKDEIEAVTLQFNPDIFIISEANQMKELSVQEKNITGYRQILPKIVDVQRVARLVLLVREGINVEVKEEYMEYTVAAVWIKVGVRGRKPLLIAGVYREHNFMFQPDGSDEHTNR